jgi:hypothetical protein
MNIIKLLSKYTENKPIDLFVGTNHALRLAYILQYKYIDSPLVDYLLPRASMKPIGDIDSEKCIIKQAISATNLR